MDSQQALPSIFESEALDLSAYRQLCQVAVGVCEDLATDATRAMTRGRGGAMRKKANALVEKAVAGLEPAEVRFTGLAVLKAAVDQIDVRASEIAQDLMTGPMMLDLDADGELRPDLVSRPAFLRSFTKLHAIVEGIRMLAPGIEAVGAVPEAMDRAMAAEVQEMEPDLLEYVCAAWIGALADKENLPQAVYKRHELDDKFGLFERQSLYAIAEEVGSIPFAVARSGFFGLPIVITGVDEDAEEVTGFTTAAFHPDLHLSYDAEWRSTQMLKEPHRRDYTYLAVDPGVLDMAVEAFNEMTGKPYVQRLMNSLSPADAAASLGCSTIKLNQWLRDRGYMEHVDRKNCLSRSALGLGYGFMEETKFGPKLSLDARFVEMLRDCAPEIAKTKRTALPPEPPTMNQIEYARKLADKLNIILDDEHFASKKTCSAAIDLLKMGENPNEQLGARMRM